MAVMDEIREELEIEQLIANALNWTEYNKYQKYIEYISNNLEMLFNFDTGLFDNCNSHLSIKEKSFLDLMIISSFLLSLAV